MITLKDIFKGDYPVTQTYGANPSYYGQFYIYGVKQRGHEGVDWATPIGTEITAPFDGTVLRSGWQGDFPGYGNVVVLWDEAQKVAVWYAHLSEAHVGRGEKVKAGDVLGKTGNTGNSTGPHLHFAIVNTDAYGNRLNQYDGMGGFFNPLNSALVKWELGKPVVNEWVSKVDKLKIAVDRVKAEFDSQLANANVNKQELYKSIISKLNKIVQTGSL